MTGWKRTVRARFRPARSRRRWLGMAVWPLVLMALAVAIPAIIASPPKASDSGAHFAETPGVELEDTRETIAIPVYRTASGIVERVPLEVYVRGVLAAEMPADFEMEALKAQAIAARTYIIRRLWLDDRSQVPVPDALVTDSVTHQAFLNEEQLRQQEPPGDYARKMSRWNRAVNETAGLIATYRGEPIQAVFFSTSNGFTEDSENYFSDTIPYLRSVPSPWDIASPRYEATVTFSLRQVAAALSLDDNLLAGLSDGTVEARVIEKTASGRVKRFRIGDREFTGRQMRELLGLASSDFVWTQDHDEVTITTYGYGHGVGMSQWGANGLAQEQKSAADIIAYYYQGVQIEAFDEERWRQPEKEI